MRKSTLLRLVSLGFSASILACSGGTTVTTDPGVALTYGAPFILSCSDAMTSVGDVDGDGHGDLVLTCKNGSSYVAKVYLAADGALSEPVETPVSGSGYLFDVDGDGRVDYVTYDSFYSGAADGGFAAPKKASIPSGERGFDVDGDGFLDVLAWNGTKLTAYSIDAVGEKHVIYTVDSVDRPPSFGDLDGDGKLDMFYAMGSAIVARFGKGGGAFTPAQAILTADMAVRSVQSVEIDGDGHLDLALTVGSSTTEGYVLLRNKGDGTFAQVKTIAAVSGVSVSFEDANGDGRVDVVMKAKEQLAVAPGTGSGTFLDATLITGPWSDASRATFKDINADGRVDLLVANGSVSVLLRK